MKDLRVRCLLCIAFVIPLSSAGAQQPVIGAPSPGQDLIWEHIETLETMVSLWPEREYYLQLARLYGHSGNFERQLELYEISDAMGWLTETAQFIELARLLLWAERYDEVDAFLHKALEAEAAGEDSRSDEQADTD